MQPLRPKTCDKKFKNAELKVQKILNKIKALQLSHSYISKLEVHGKSEPICRVTKGFLKLYGSFACLLILILGLWWTYSEFSSKNCLLVPPSFSKSLFRPPEDCAMCAGVDAAVRLTNISAREFEDRYAYSAGPVIVTDATEGWLAVQEFNFEFFKQFYSSQKMGQQINDCFYFAYKSGLKSLREVFEMEESRANLSGQPWYVGWSTCHDEETRKLRSYYSRPYFLPETAESDMVDWVFMGGPGQGAHMHVDSVRHMSWQAQIRGRKQWELAPPPECFYRCRWLGLTVQPGEILVVDTNRWYHKTNVLPGDISITIGAEYD